MKVMITVNQEIAMENNVLESYELGEPIPVPKGKDIYMKVPRGVFRINLNEGIFPEDRRFFQKLEHEPDSLHLIRYSEIAHLKNPVISIKVHYPGDDEDIQMEFR